MAFDISGFDNIEFNIPAGKDKKSYHHHPTS